MPGVILYKKPLCLQRINSPIFIHGKHSSGCREWGEKLVLHRLSMSSLGLVLLSLLLPEVPGAADSSTSGVREFLNLSSIGLEFSFPGSASLVIVLPSVF